MRPAWTPDDEIRFMKMFARQDIPCPPNIDDAVFNQTQPNALNAMERTLELQRQRAEREKQKREVPAAPAIEFETEIKFETEVEEWMRSFVVELPDTAIADFTLQVPMAQCRYSLQQYMLDREVVWNQIWAFFAVSTVMPFCFAFPMNLAGKPVTLRVRKAED